jgi:preprotein translocase subunit SecY
MTFWQKLTIAFKDRTIRNKILFLLGMLIIFRLLAAVPVPGVDVFQLQSLIQSNQFFGLLNIFSGGGLSSLSLVMLGVGPLITASIVMQLLTVMSPRLKSMYHEEGAIGRERFTQISRIVAIPLALIQGFGLLLLLQQQGVLVDQTTLQTATNLASIVVGSFILIWLGELISEYGIGNGVSIIIFAGIVSAVPSQISQLAFTFDIAQLPLYIAFVLLAIIIVAGVILITEAERLIPTTYANASRQGGSSGTVHSFLPLRINMAGVMPIIFALSILLFPQLIISFLASSTSAFAVSLSSGLNWFLQSTWIYSLAYFLLVFLFTYFYTSITFDPEAVATNLQKNGAFIPGVRPGVSTQEYIAKIVKRVTFLGGLFLGLIAVLPILMQQLTGIATLAIGGTALLIAVSVILDLTKKIDGAIAMRQY